MEDFKSEAELKDFMARIERENYDAYIGHLEKQHAYVLSKIETKGDYHPGLKDLYSIRLLCEKIVESLNTELATTPAPYEFADLNKALLERRDYYLSAFKAFLQDINYMIGEY